MTGCSGKFSCGGGDETCHSSVRACQGLLSAIGPRIHALMMLYMKTRNDAPSRNPERLTIMFRLSSDDGKSAIRRFIPLTPGRCMVKNVRLKPMNIHQKWSFASVSLYIRPVIFGNQ